MHLHPEAAPPSAPPLPVVMMQMITGKWITQAIYVAAKLGIADLLKDGPKTSAQLAQAAAVDELSLYRVLRALASIGIFAQTEQGRFELTPLAALLGSEHPQSLRDMAMMVGMNATWLPWGEIMYSVETGQPAFEKVHQSDAFSYYSQSPEEGEIFNRAMVNLSSQASFAVVEAYSFAGIHQLVDVGGGYGTLLAGILRANPSMQGVLFDLPPTIEAAKEFLASQGVAERCQLVAGDFTQTIPLGGDAYLLKNILHGCKDEQAVTLLRKCREAMTPDGKLLVVESIIPPGNQPDFGKLLDLEMLVQSGGRERTEAEFRQLYEAAGFRLTRIVPTRSPVSIIEGIKA